MYVGNYYDKPYDRSIRYVKDTILCGKTYAAYSWEKSPARLVHFTRYDSGRVYLYMGCNDEVLQYDFNLKLKEKFTIQGWEKVRLTVDTIGTIKLYDYSERKYIGLQGDNGIRYEWVEGIGDLNRGLLYLFDFEGGHDELTCHKEYNQMIWYNTTDYYCGDLLKTVFVDDIAEISSDYVAIFPNPVLDIVSIQFKKPNPFAVSIVDVLGNTVISEEGVLNSTSISLAGFQPGIYVVKISDGTSSYTRKLVVN